MKLTKYQAIIFIIFFIVAIIGNALNMVWFKSGIQAIVWFSVIVTGLVTELIVAERQGSRR